LPLLSVLSLYYIVRFFRGLALGYSAGIPKDLRFSPAYLSLAYDHKMQDIIDITQYMVYTMNMKGGIQ